MIRKGDGDANGSGAGSESLHAWSVLGTALYHAHFQKWLPKNAKLDGKTHAFLGRGEEKIESSISFFAALFRHADDEFMQIQSTLTVFERHQESETSMSYGIKSVPPTCSPYANSTCFADEADTNPDVNADTETDIDETDEETGDDHAQLETEATDAASTAAVSAQPSSPAVAAGQPYSVTPITPSSGGSDLTPEQVRETYKNEIDQAAKDSGIPAEILAGMAWQESKGIADVAGGGLMQLGPNEFEQYGGGDINNPADNLHAGAMYMKDLVAQFGGDIPTALRAYNSGPNGVDRSDLDAIPAGTGDPTYVGKVLGAAEQAGLTTA